MKKLLYLFLAITFISCSDDDSESNTPFLTQYNDVIWVETYDETTDYWLIFETNGVTEGKRYDDGSEEYCDSEFNGWGSGPCPINIIDNSRDLLVAESECEGVVYTVTFTVTNSGNTLTAVYSDETGYSEVYVRRNSVPCQ